LLLGHFFNVKSFSVVPVAEQLALSASGGQGSIMFSHPSAKKPQDSRNNKKLLTKNDKSLRNNKFSR